MFEPRNRFGEAQSDRWTYRDHVAHKRLFLTIKVACESASSSPTAVISWWALLRSLRFLLFKIGSRRRQSLESPVGLFFVPFVSFCSRLVGAGQDKP
jgi:hypothetical protein